MQFSNCNDCSKDDLYLNLVNGNNSMDCDVVLRVTRYMLAWAVFTISISSFKM